MYASDERTWIIGNLPTISLAAGSSTHYINE
jgi:hypothetical protein